MLRPFFMSALPIVIPGCAGPESIVRQSRRETDTGFALTRAPE